ncbi:hypothetical protein K2173_013406 [Erythroxylum novogranatense]|uniref:ATG8-interacting protein 1 n=1 Tax=Erythroxylum novogranatense TaxID=1862640 RepID=A0AAV8SAA0_9ROSI|nr:hypothetical protein K2173_013406 [Erythroxylum novogranatense]
MADNDEKEENTPRGVEWEVVHLTESTYAAAPGPKQVEVKDDGKENTCGEDEGETSRALFMSDHFVFPPNQHENLPLDPDNSEIVDEYAVKNLLPEVNVQKVDRSDEKEEENSAFKGLNVSEEFPGMQLFDEEGNRISISGKEFEESTKLQRSILSDKKQSMYSTATFDSFHNEACLGESTTLSEKLDIPDANEPSEGNLDFPMDGSHSAEATKEGTYDRPSVPTDAWWKRRAASVYSHAKDANAFWSIFIAAAVMGLVIIGQRWQQERWQTNVNNERSGRLLGPVYRLRDVLVGGHRRGSFITGSASSDN